MAPTFSDVYLLAISFLHFYVGSFFHFFFHPSYLYTVPWEAGKDNLFPVRL
jgi:hypothetical protein